MSDQTGDFAAFATTETESVNPVTNGSMDEETEMNERKTDGIEPVAQQQFQEKKGHNNYDFFDPEAYIQEYYLQDGTDAYNDFIFTKLAEYFQSGMLKGKSMLEVGTGPVPLVSMYAAEHYDDIYLSDFGKPNLEFLKAWKKKEKTHLLRPIFGKVAQKIGNGWVAENIERALRQKIRSIVHCDVLRAHPIGQVEVPKFDFVAAPYCIDEAVDDLQQLRDVFLNISSLLKPGGLFLYFDDDSTCYQSNGQTFEVKLRSKPCCIMAERQKAFNNAGYNVLDGCTDAIVTTPKICDMYNCNTNFAFLAQKVKPEMK